VGNNGTKSQNAGINRYVERRCVWSPAGVMVPFVVVTGLARFVRS
jgi:hypothetical protein